MHRDLLRVVIKARLQETLNSFLAQCNEFAKKTADPLHTKGLLLDHLDRAWVDIKAELQERLEREKEKAKRSLDEGKPE